MRKIFVLIIALFAVTSVSMTGYGSRVRMDVFVGEADSLSILFKELQDSINVLRPVIDSLRGKNNYKKGSLSELRNEIAQLKADISKEEEREKRLKVEFSEISEKERDVQNEKAEIDREENKIVTDLINKYQGFLNTPFSRMSLNDLSQINKECKRYSDNSKMNAFLERVESSEKYKGIYDEMLKTMESPYDKSRIDKVLSEAEAMEGINPEQKTEVDAAKELLRKFPDGLKAFGEFLKNLNATRTRAGGDFVWQDYKDEEKYIITPELKERIDNFLLPVPYLRDKYNAFMAEFQNAPAVHSAIEKEILDLCETIGDN